MALENLPFGIEPRLGETERACWERVKEHAAEMPRRERQERLAELREARKAPGSLKGADYNEYSLLDKLESKAQIADLSMLERLRYIDEHFQLVDYAFDERSRAEQAELDGDDLLSSCIEELEAEALARARTAPRGRASELAE